MCLNLVFMFKKSGFAIKPLRLLAKPMISGILCGFAAYYTAELSSFTSMSNRICTLLSIAVAAAVYFVSLVVMKGLNRYDVMMMPKGAKLCKLLDRFNLLDKGE